MAYLTSPDDAHELDESMRQIRSVVRDPRGSTLDPRAVLATFRSLLEIAHLAPLKRPLLDPRQLKQRRDFLYLTLPPSALSTPISELDLAANVCGPLLHDAIETVEDLLERSESEVQAVPRLAGKRADDIKQAIADCGWHFSPHDSYLAPPEGDRWVTVGKRVVLLSRLGRVSVKELGPLSIPEIFGALWDFGVRRIGQLAALDQDAFQRLPWLGRPIPFSDATTTVFAPDKILREVRDALWVYNLELPGSNPSLDSTP